MGNLFNVFARKASDLVGTAWMFFLAVLFVGIWLCSGPIFHFSDTWQLVINTSTTIITFLIVFLIQHSQNRDTESIQIKLDELIRSHKPAKNSTINLEKLSDSQLKKLEEKYNELAGL